VFSIFCLVGIANLLDANVLDAGSMLRTAVIFFYCANKGISIVENAARTGLPVPEKLTEVMRQLKSK
jgi:toxin secretion/phage lysis holin